MRVQIIADGATTEQMRDLCAAVASEAFHGCTVRCDGPELWHVETPKMAPNPFARVVGRLVKKDGVPVVEALA